MHDLYEKGISQVLVENKISALTNDKVRGIVAGYLKRKQEMAEGKSDFIWSDKDLNEKLC